MISESGQINSETGQCATVFFTRQYSFSDSASCHAPDGAAVIEIPVVRHDDIFQKVSISIKFRHRG